MAEIYVALLSMDIEGNPRECQGAGYARVKTEYEGQKIEATFPRAEGNWGLIIGFALHDEEGNLLANGSFPNPMAVMEGDVLDADMGIENHLPALPFQPKEPIGDVTVPEPKTAWERIRDDEELA